MTNRFHQSPAQATRSKGFTLVELLVVIGIIALLIGILLPTLSKARESANRAVCASNQRQIVLAILTYASEHKQRLPGPCIASVNDPKIVNPVGGATTSLMTTWGGDTWFSDRNLSNVNLLQKYVGGVSNDGIWRCPSSRTMWENASPSTASSLFYGKRLGYGYLLNNMSQTKSTYPAWLFGTANRPALNPDDTEEDRTPKKLNQIYARIGPSGNRVNTKDSTKIWLITDLDGRNFGREVSTNFGISPGASGDSSLVKNSRPYQPVHTGRGKRPDALGRIFAFLDGHAEWVLFYNWPNNDDT